MGRLRYIRLTRRQRVRVWLAIILLALTALLALVLDADPWFVSLAIQAESFLKCPICLWRIRSRKWIHDVTLPEGRRDD